MFYCLLSLDSDLKCLYPLQMAFMNCFPRARADLLVCEPFGKRSTFANYEFLAHCCELLLLLLRAVEPARGRRRRSS